VMRVWSGSTTGEAEGRGRLLRDMQHTAGWPLSTEGVAVWQLPLHAHCAGCLVQSHLCLLGIVCACA
jgi:hypothetical protein